VIAVIAVLSAITFGISGGVQNKKNRAVAKSDIASLSQALELFKTSKGDYPWIQAATDDPEANAELLLQALLGWKKFERVSNEVQFIDRLASEVSESGPKSFIDASKYRIRQIGSEEPFVELPSVVSSSPSGYYLADPWGQPYVYRYKAGSASSWNNFGYILYSQGPDSVDQAVEDDGILTPAIRESDENIDNIYSGEY
jgi:type II secretory pathway pseudopilin PulG